MFDFNSQLADCQICGKKFGFLTKITIFDQNYNFGRKLQFFGNIMIFDQNYYLLIKITILTKITYFYHFFLTKIMFFHQKIFAQNFDF